MSQLSPMPQPQFTQLQSQCADASLEGRFDDSVFRSLYQRNNKRGGLKNLRCFPSCGAEHKVRGFCGRSVVVTFKSTSLQLPEPSRLRAFVEFEEEPYEVEFPEKVSVDEIESLLRTKSEPTNPLIEGRHHGRTWTKDGILVFEFNQERRGWHYSWGSNKHKCDTKHHLVCKLYEEREPGVLTFLSACTSPDFVLFCRRRRRFTLEPTAQVCSSTSSKRARKSSSQTKFVQEIELVTTVHRIEAARNEEEEDMGSTSSGSEDTTSYATNRFNKRIRTMLDSKPLMADYNDITDATQALLALNSHRSVPVSG